MGRQLGHFWFSQTLNCHHKTKNRGRSSAIYRLDRYMPPARVWFFKASILKINRISFLGLTGIASQVVYMRSLNRLPNLYQLRLE